MEYRKEIDGLRALAVLPVVFFHAGFPFFSGGFVGVDIFFVISGYLISSIIISEKERGVFTFFNFWERRARRILPALFLVIFASIPFAWFFLLPNHMQKFSASVAAVSIFISNHLFANQSGYFDTDATLKPLLHTWSLSVEEQFYLFFPLFLIFIWNLGEKWILRIIIFIAVISLIFADYYSAKNPSAFYWLPTRCWELLIGSIVALSARGNNFHNTSKVVQEIGAAGGLLLILMSIFFYTSQIPFPGFYALVPTLGTALILLFGKDNTATGKLIGNKYFVGVGLISYSIYLWHHPVFAFIKHQSLGEPNVSWYFFALALILILSFISWRFVEIPCRNKSTLKRKTLFIFFLFSTLLCLLFGYIGMQTKGSFGRDYSKTYDLIRQVLDDRGRNNRCWDLITKSKSLSDACEIGEKKIAKDFAIVGDSHAGSLVHQLDIQAKKHNLSGLNFTLSGCPMLRGGDRVKQDENQVACSSIRKEFFDKLSKNVFPKTLIVSSRWAIKIEKERFNNKEGGVEKGESDAWMAPNSQYLGYENALIQNYKESIELMINSGYRVILIYPWPEMGWNVPDRMGKLYLINGSVSPKDASISYSVFWERNRKAIDSLDAIKDSPNLIRIKPWFFFCNVVEEGRCSAHVNGNPLYYDDDHLSSTGANLIVEKIIMNLK